MTHSLLKAQQPGTFCLICTWNAPEAPGLKSAGVCVGGSTPTQNMGSNRLLLPRGSRAPFQSANKAPGCLGTFPSKCARAASLSGKHGLPCPPPCHHHLCQLCSVGTLWGHGLGMRTPGTRVHMFPVHQANLSWEWLVQPTAPVNSRGFISLSFYLSHFSHTTQPRKWQ